MLFGTMLSGLAETLALGEKVGLQQEQILEILSLLPMSSKLNQAKGDGLLTAFFHLSDKYSALWTGHLQCTLSSLFPMLLT